MKYTKQATTLIAIVAILLSSFSAYAAGSNNVDRIYLSYMDTINVYGTLGEDRTAAVEAATVEMLANIAEALGANPEEATGFDAASALIARTLEPGAEATDALTAWAVIADHYNTQSLARGSRGKAVRSMQAGLTARDADALPVYGVDGIFGAETAGAVASFQMDAGLPATGACGASTQALLNADGADSVLALMRAAAEALDEGHSLSNFTAQYADMTAADIAEAKFEMSCAIAAVLSNGTAQAVPAAKPAHKLAAKVEVVTPEQPEEPKNPQEPAESEQPKEPEAPAHIHSWVDVTETVTVPEQGHWETVHYPAGSHKETITHPEEGYWDAIIHPAITHTETVIHPTEYAAETIEHPEEGHWELVHHDAETRSEWRLNADTGLYEFVTVVVKPAYDEHIWVVDQEVWTETKIVVVKEAWTETKTIVDEPAWSEWIWVVVREAWTETVTVIDEEAHDENVWVTDVPAHEELQIIGQRCETCGETKK